MKEKMLFEHPLFNFKVFSSPNKMDIIIFYCYFQKILKIYFEKKSGDVESTLFIFGLIFNFFYWDF